MSRGILLLVLVQGLTGCSDPASSWRPFAPSPVPQPVPLPVPPPAPISVVVFTDGTTGFSTADVHDAQDQIVRFNTAGELIWAADDSRFPGYRASGRLGETGSWEVRFGTKGGERRAYLTFSLEYYHYTPPPIVVDLEVVSGQLVISDARAPVPLPGS